jgi:hypothetical protein
VLADIEAHVYAELERSELINLFGKEAIFGTSADAIRAYHLTVGENKSK